jgi:hypothetical protein
MTIDMTKIRPGCMTSNDMPDDCKIRYNVTTDICGTDISIMENINGQFSKMIIKTKEAAVRESLIKLGWQPPADLCAAPTDNAEALEALDKAEKIDADPFSGRDEIINAFFILSAHFKTFRTALLRGAGEKWQPIDTLHPNINVLLYCGESNPFIGQKRFDGKWIILGAEISSSLVSKITHWMPLPNPPTNEAEGK